MRAQADKIAKHEETNRAATRIIDAEVKARITKTERLRKARLDAERRPAEQRQ